MPRFEVMVEQVEETIRKKLAEVPLTPSDRRFLEGVLVIVDAYLGKGEGRLWEEMGQTPEDLMLPDTFGQRLAHYRGRAGISQSDLARRIGMEPAYLSRIEHGRIKPPKLDKVLIMARVLHLPPVHILGLVELAGYSPELLLQIQIT